MRIGSIDPQKEAQLAGENESARDALDDSKPVLEPKQR